MIELQFPWRWQPRAPRVNWRDPITRGLVGLVWMGPGGPRDLVAQPFALATTAVSLAARRHGIASVVTVPSSSGVYSPRNDYGQWKPADAPLTFLAFFDYVTPLSSRPIVGNSSSNLGFAIWDLYGSRDRLCRIRLGTSVRDASGGQWASGVAVRGMSVTRTAIDGYEGGVRYGGSTYAAATGITYDETYARLYMLGSPDNSSVAGEAYWMAIWARGLSPAEHARIGRNPWCWAEPLRMWVPSAGGVAIPSDALWLTAAGEFVTAGSAGANKRVHLMADGSWVASAAAVPGGRPMRHLTSGERLA